MEQAANQTSPPGSPKKKKWPVILAGVVAFIILAVGLAFYFTAGMVGVVEKQLEFLRQGDIKSAYGLTSKDFQKATSLEKFTAFVKQYPSLSQNQGHTFTTRTIENNIGTVKGTLTARDGAVTPVMFQLVKEQGEWRILFIEARATGAGTGIKGEEKLLSLVTCEGVEDYRPVNITDQFNPESPKIHVVAKIKNVSAGTKATGVWIAVDALATPNHEINRSELVFEKEGTGSAHFLINKPNKGWPVGNYKLDLYIDGKIAGTAPFKVSKTALPGSSSR